MQHSEIKTQMEKRIITHLCYSIYSVRVWLSGPGIGESKLIVGCTNNVQSRIGSTLKHYNIVSGRESVETLRGPRYYIIR